jgi:hypothetical protein
MLYTGKRNNNNNSNCFAKASSEKIKVSDFDEGA